MNAKGKTPFLGYAIGKGVVDTFTRMGTPYQWQQDKKQKFEPMHDSVKLDTLHSSKELEFPLGCMPAIGEPAGEEQALEDEALAVCGDARATEELVMTHHEESVLGEKVRKAMGC
jgi:superfamily I DNA/RNA helicase